MPNNLKENREQKQKTKYIYVWTSVECVRRSLSRVWTFVSITKQTTFRGNARTRQRIGRRLVVAISLPCQTHFFFHFEIRVDSGRATKIVVRNTWFSTFNLWHLRISISWRLFSCRLARKCASRINKQSTRNFADRTGSCVTCGEHLIQIKKPDDDHRRSHADLSRTFVWCQLHACENVCSYRNCCLLDTMIYIDSPMSCTLCRQITETGRMWLFAFRMAFDNFISLTSCFA